MMVNRFLFGVTFAAVGALAYGWYYNNQRIVSSQQAQIEKFINAGPRFTAHDGEELCLRIRRLEQVSYGYRDSGLVPMNCDYDKRR